MKVLFIGGPFESLGVEYLSSALRAAGHSTDLCFDPRLFDDAFLRMGPLARAFSFHRRIVDAAVASGAGLIAFSVVSADYKYALNLAQCIKEGRDVPIVFGGIHPTSAPEAVLRHHHVDYAVQGEGEAAVVDLADRLSNGEAPHGVRNVALRVDGRAVRNPVRPLIEDLDSLPWPDKDLYYSRVPAMSRHYTVLTSRGCPNRCSYCHNHVEAGIYAADGVAFTARRQRSIEPVIDELMAARRRWSFRALRINDDLFGADREWLDRFLPEYGRRVGVPFMCSMSPEHVDRRVVRMLVNAGCFQVCVGVQSINLDLRKRVLNRTESLEQVERAIVELRDAGLRATMDNIIGLPGQTDEQVLDMARFYHRMRPRGRAAVFWLIYFPRTNILDHAIESGVLEHRYRETAADDPIDSANTIQAGPHARAGRRLHVLLLLIQLLPRRVAEWLLADDHYRFVPAIPPSLIEIPWTVVSADRKDPVRRRYWRRYLTFGLRRIFGWRP